LSSVQKNLSFSLLAVIRRHNTQAMMILRQVLESSVLGCYGLYDNDINKFYKKEIYEHNKSIDKIRKSVYNWVKGEYPEYSDAIKTFKDEINKQFAHANIVHASTDILSEQTFLFFDKKDEILTKNLLCVIAWVSSVLLNFFSKVIQDFPLVKVVDNFENKVKKLESERYKIAELVKAAYK